MIALPVAAHNSSNKDSAHAMSGAEDWPSLAASHGHQEPAAGAVGDDWEMLSPASDSAATNGSVEVVMIPPRCRITRKNSVSAPDLRELDVTADEDQDVPILQHDDDAQMDISSSVVMVSTPASVAESSSVVMVSNPWSTKNKVTFKDAIMSPSKHASAANAPAPSSAPRVRNKVKSRYVVTPIKRCAKSTGDLLSLVTEEDEDEEPMGAEDAMEYYHRKSHGAHGRSNGLKQRPDEAKRKEMIVQKKHLQRQKQAK